MTPTPFSVSSYRNAAFYIYFSLLYYWRSQVHWYTIWLWCRKYKCNCKNFGINIQKTAWFWYIWPSFRVKISKKDSFRQYIAYHEGWGNYKNYKKNTKVISLAKRVQKQSKKYKSQLLSCQSSLRTRKYIIF